MKIRTGFVSNSSSSSFIVSKDSLTNLQIDLIKNHAHEAKKYGIDYSNYPWKINDTGQSLEGYTMMDNFNMKKFMYRIGVDLSKVEFEADVDWDI